VIENIFGTIPPVIAPKTSLIPNLFTKAKELFLAKQHFRII
jgi:hypothetical protein